MISTSQSQNENLIFSNNFPNFQNNELNFQDNMLFDSNIALDIDKNGDTQSKSSAKSQEDLEFVNNKTSYPTIPKIEEKNKSEEETCHKPIFKFNFQPKLSKLEGISSIPQKNLSTNEICKSDVNISTVNKTNFLFNRNINPPPKNSFVDIIPKKTILSENINAPALTNKFSNETSNLCKNINIKKNIEQTQKNLTTIGMHNENQIFKNNSKFSFQINKFIPGNLTVKNNDPTNSLLATSNFGVKKIEKISVNKNDVEKKTKITGTSFEKTLIMPTPIKKDYFQNDLFSKSKTSNIVFKPLSFNTYNENQSCNNASIKKDPGKTSYFGDIFRKVENFIKEEVDSNSDGFSDHSKLVLKNIFSRSISDDSQSILAEPSKNMECSNYKVPQIDFTDEKEINKFSSDEKNFNQHAKTNEIDNYVEYETEIKINKKNESIVNDKESHQTSNVSKKIPCEFEEDIFFVEKEMQLIQDEIFMIELKKSTLCFDMRVLQQNFLELSTEIEDILIDYNLNLEENLEFDQHPESL